MATKPEKNKWRNCIFCKETFAKLRTLIEHLSVHNINIALKHRNFESEDEFKVWKADYEKRTTSEFCKERGRTKYKSTCSWYYICNRSGWRTSKATKRHSKAIGSNKINGTCPAYIKKAVTTKPDGTLSIKVEYCDVHVGHVPDAARLRISDTARKILSAKILAGVPIDKILQDETKKFGPDNRDGLITRLDLRNIARSTKTKSGCGLLYPQSDSISIEQFQSCEEQGGSPVLLYKPFDNQLKELLTVDSNEFILGLMNNLQIDMLATFGFQGIFIDSTQGIDDYDIHLTTVMIRDSNLHGFPVAFLLSSRASIETYTLFFKEIDERLKLHQLQINPPFIMTGDFPGVYNAWVSVFGSQIKHFICPWYINKEWNSKLLEIENEFLCKQIQRNLSAMHKELDVGNFQRELELNSKNWRENEVTRAFGEYFDENYLNRPEEWANCYRKQFRINSKIFERWQSELNYSTFFEGTIMPSIDKTLHALMSTLIRKAANIGMSHARCILTKMLTLIQDRHELSADDNIDDIIELEPEQKWLVPSIKSSVDINFYGVTANPNCHCNCRLVCNECFNICLHQFSCTCSDYNIRIQICQHIHLVAQKLGRNPRLTVILTATACEDGLIIDDKPVENVIEVVTTEVITESVDDVVLNQKISKGLEVIYSLEHELINAQSNEEADYIINTLSTILPGLESIRSLQSLDE